MKAGQLARFVQGMDSADVRRCAYTFWRFRYSRGSISARLTRFIGQLMREADRLEILEGGLPAGYEKLKLQ